MPEVILNDECIHCNDKECHDGENFCRQVMKDNSFYKNAKLYKGLEVLQRPTYEALEKENAILKKALHLYVDWADECGIAWDNFPDMKEKWYKTVEEKGLGWIDGLIFMVTEEAKEQLNKENGKCLR